MAPEEALIRLARRQHGLLSARDLAAHLRTPKEVRRRLRSPAWQQVLPQVIAPAVIEIDRTLLEHAALLWAPAGGWSHFTAARKEGIWVPDDPNAWLTTPWEDGHRSRAGVEIVRTRHLPAWRTDGVRRWTPPARTVVDLAQVLDERQLNAVLLSAVRKKKATAAEVDAAAVGLAGRAGLRLLHAVTQLWTPERESLLEDELHVDVLSVVQGFTVERQFDVRDSGGRLLGRTDVAVPALKLALEADGLLFHSTDQQIAADQQRDRRFLGAGWQTARFREGALGDRALVRRDVAAIIAERARQLNAA